MAHRRWTASSVLQIESGWGSPLPEFKRELVRARVDRQSLDRRQQKGHKEVNEGNVIESYIDDTVRFLPRRERDDVAAELRTLLNDELHARASKSGRTPDKTGALSLVRSYGRPSEAAARYHPAWTIIDSADSNSFIRAAIIGACA